MLNKQKLISNSLEPLTNDWEKNIKESKHGNIQNVLDLINNGNLNNKRKTIISIVEFKENNYLKGEGRNDWQQNISSNKSVY